MKMEAVERKEDITRAPLKTNQVFLQLIKVLDLLGILALSEIQ
jgi:hypothetical protein